MELEAKTLEAPWHLYTIGIRAHLLRTKSNIDAIGQK